MGLKDADLSPNERVHAVQNLFPEDIENYLKAKNELLKMDR